MLNDLERRDDGIQVEINRIINEDEPAGVFFIALHTDRDHTILFTSNLELRGLAAQLRILADIYDKESDANNGEPRMIQ